MRLEVAKANGFQPYKSYGEQQAAGWIDIDYATIKRWRRAGHVCYVAQPGGGVKYLGIHIADIITLGKNARDFDLGTDLEQPKIDGRDKAWVSAQKSRSSSESSGSPENPDGLDGSDAVRKDARSDAPALALSILRKRNAS